MRRVYANMVRRNDYIKNKEQDTRNKIHVLAETASKRGHYKTARVCYIIFILNRKHLLKLQILLFR